VSRSKRGISVRAFAKINLTLKVLGLDAAGYHELRTTFQSVALHDTLTFTPVRTGWSIECDDPACPSDRTNLVWKAARSLWREVGRRGLPSGVHVRIQKGIPVQSGLGGGSSDAAATLRALLRLWQVRVHPERLHALCRDLGSDVPFFLYGGTMLGVERGDVLFRLADWPASWVVLVLPSDRVRTADAYRWWDKDVGRRTIGRAGSSSFGVVPRSELTNDLEKPVVARHPDIATLIDRLQRLGASHAMMTGSGSTVFGLFDRASVARSAATALAGGSSTVVTQTLARPLFERASRPGARLAGPLGHRVHFAFAPRGFGRS
jgi:4-diphosphocytidyl-2-C-methyl-D-erythritol kinase